MYGESGILTHKLVVVPTAKSAGVEFGYAFYILLVGGLLSLGAAAFNLLFARSAAERRRSLRLRIRCVCVSVCVCVCVCV